jgi:hypothetical protein
MIHHCVPLLIGVFRPGLAERRIVLEKKIQINPVPPAGHLRCRSHISSIIRIVLAGRSGSFTTESDSMTKSHSLKHAMTAHC